MTQIMGRDAPARRGGGVVAGRRSAEGCRTPCGSLNCTLREVLEYLPQSTRVLSAKYAGGVRTAPRPPGQATGLASAARARQAPPYSCRNSSPRMPIALISEYPKISCRKPRPA